MDINLLPFTIGWMLLAVLVIGLIAYRRWAAREEDERLHVATSEIGVVSRQAAVAQKLESIDRWGQLLTVITLLYGLAVGASYLYQQLLASAR